MEPIASLVPSELVRPDSLSEELPSGLRPGAISALLADLAREPGASAGWTQPPAPGESIGRFEVEREIGRGGFGVVYAARDKELGRRVAFKTVRAPPPGALQQEQALSEAEAAARLTHPNIVTLHDVGRVDRGAYLILELLDGETLRERLRRGQVDRREALRIAVEVARALAHAHGAKVVHHDLAPSNVFLCGNRQVKVLDFGLARVFERGGGSGGTPGYIAPEQVAGGSAGARGDVYALGVMLYQLLCGKLPFDPGADPGVPKGGSAPPLPGLPARMGKLIARMLARDPADRPATGEEAYRELAAIQRQLEPRTALRLAVAAALLAVLFAIGTALWTRAPPLQPGRLTVALADVTNATGDASLDGLSVLLGTALEQSKRISLVARSRLLQLLRQGGSAVQRIDEALAAKAARAAQAHVLLLPIIRETGRELEIEVRGFDLARGEVLFTVRDRALGKKDAPASLDRISDRVRAELREDPKDAPQPRLRVAQVLPANPEAWRLYAEGQRLISEAKRDEAFDVYRRALDIEPVFAIVHAELARVIRADDNETAQRHIQAALRGIDRVPPKEREWLEAVRAQIDYRMADAVEHYDRAITGWPQDPRAYFEAQATILYYYRDGARARPYQEKALELGIHSQWQTIILLMQLDRTEEAVERARSWVQEKPESGRFGYLASALLASGDTDAALAAARRAVAVAPQPPVTRFFDGLNSPSKSAVWTYLEAGAADEFESVLTRHGLRPYWMLALRGQRRAALAAYDALAPRPDAPLFERGNFHNRRMDYLSGDGDADGIWREIEEQLRVGYAAGKCGAVQLALVGDLNRAQRVLDFSIPFDPRWGCARYPRLLAGWRKGEHEVVLRGLDDMAPDPLGAYLRGALRVEIGRDREAVEALRRYRRRLGTGVGQLTEPHLVFYPRSLYLEAVALERLGERAEARAVLDRLLALWKAADPEVPTLREARALRARLAQAAPAAK